MSRGLFISRIRAKVLKGGRDCEAAGRDGAGLARNEDALNPISFERHPVSQASPTLNELVTNRYKDGTSEKVFSSFLVPFS